MVVTFRGWGVTGQFSMPISRSGIVRLVPPRAVLLISLVGLTAGCNEAVPAPESFSSEPGSWCFPDVSSARKMGDEAMFTYKCESAPDSERSKSLGSSPHGRYIGSNVTRRFSCPERRIIEVTVTTFWQEAASATSSSTESRQVVPNSPVEKAMEYACAQ